MKKSLIFLFIIVAFSFFGCETLVNTLVQLAPQGQSRRLLAEHQPAIGGELRLGVISRCLCGCQPQVDIGVLCEKVIQIFIHMNIHHVPVIQTRPFYRLVTDVKTQGFDQMQTASGGGAGTRDIAGIHWDLRLH